MKKALITGITGQDGSYLSEFLLEKGYEVHGIIRRSSIDKKERIEHLMQENNFYLHYGDMTDSMDGLTGSMSAEVNAYGSDASQLGSSNVYNGGNISINVYGAEGQNVDDLAKQIAYRLEEMTRRKEAVYG